MMIKNIQFDNDLVIVYLVAFFIACLVLCLGFHPTVLISVISSSMFLMLPFQPLPPSLDPSF